MPCAPLKTTPVRNSVCGSLINTFPPGALKNTVFERVVYRAEGRCSFCLAARLFEIDSVKLLARRPVTLATGRRGAIKHRGEIFTHNLHLLKLAMPEFNERFQVYLEHTRWQASLSIKNTLAFEDLAHLEARLDPAEHQNIAIFQGTRLIGRKDLPVEASFIAGFVVFKQPGSLPMNQAGMLATNCKR